MKTQEDNPNGLYMKYFIQKIVDWHPKNQNAREHLDDNTLAYFGPMVPEFAPVDEDSEYFVLRLDKGGKDKNHINACRKAVMKYADEIEPFIPQLAKDLREKYSELI